jgi:MerR family transcriptional regulator/heat shock protein HspR
MSDLPVPSRRARDRAQTGRDAPAAEQSAPVVPAADRGVYGITVAAELVGMGAGSLRQYEQHGLVQPGRSEGGTRRYSADDLDRLRRIGHLLDGGLNLAGVSMVLGLEADNADLRARLEADGSG